MTGDELKRRLSLDRVQNVGAVLDLLRCSELLGPTPTSARRLYATAKTKPVSGSEVARSFRYLAHYTTEFFLREIKRSNRLGTDKQGFYLTPTGYPTWLAPYELGLDKPPDRCLLIDVSNITDIWGPGLAEPSAEFQDVWRGGGLEFYVPGPVPYAYVVQIMECQDGQIHQLAT